MFEEVRLLTKVFVDWLLPNYCFSCDKPHSNEYECLCDECWIYLSPVHGKNWIDNLPDSSHLSSVYSGWYWNEVLQSVAHEIKYNGYAKTGLTLGKIKGAELKNTVSQLDCLIPVPRHRVKKRERGFNQSEWIARGIALHVNIPVELHLLKRVKYTYSQTTVSKEERNVNNGRCF